MSGYRRFVAYVYEYQKGKKGSNCGFIKVEVRDQRCSMEVHLHCSGLTPQVECRIFGFIRKDGLMNGILLGSCETEEDTAECLIETDSLNMGGSGVSLGRMGGMVLVTELGGFFGTEWDDQPIRPENFRELKVPAQAPKQKSVNERTEGSEREAGTRAEVNEEPAQPDVEAEESNPDLQEECYRETAREDYSALENGDALGRGTDILKDKGAIEKDSAADGVNRSTVRENKAAEDGILPGSGIGDEEAVSGEVEAESGEIDAVSGKVGAESGEAGAKFGEAAAEFGEAGAEFGEAGAESGEVEAEHEEAGSEPGEAGAEHEEAATEPGNEAGSEEGRDEVESNPGSMQESGEAWGRSAPMDESNRNVSETDWVEPAENTGLEDGPAQLRSGAMAADGAEATTVSEPKSAESGKHIDILPMEESEEQRLISEIKATQDVQDVHDRTRRQPPRPPMGPGPEPPRPPMEPGPRPEPPRPPMGPGPRPEPPRPPMGPGPRPEPPRPPIGPGPRPEPPRPPMGPGPRPEPPRPPMGPGPRPEPPRPPMGPGPRPQPPRPPMGPPPGPGVQRQNSNDNLGGQRRANPSPSYQNQAPSGRQNGNSGAMRKRVSFGEPFTPFSDGELIQCWKIQPQDFAYFPRRECALRNNRFLLYGYYNFGHLLLGKKPNGQYILGVPGGYDQQERFMANMFGFPYFKESRLIELPKARGGYWYRLVNAPDFH